MDGPPLKIDVFEPDDALRVLTPVVPCLVDDLNNQGYADYLWSGVEGTQQAERKTWHEIMGGMDSVEDQLRREMQAHSDIRLMLVVEGIATASFGGTEVYIEALRGKRHIFYAGKSFAIPITVAYAWLYQITKHMEVYYTPNYQSTLRLLTAFYKADQKEGHSTFHRYLKDVTFHPNPMVQRLINLGGNLGVGAARAEALIARFGTVWNVLKATPEEIGAVTTLSPKKRQQSIGTSTAEQLLRGVGRPDV